MLALFFEKKIFFCDDMLQYKKTLLNLKHLIKNIYIQMEQKYFSSERKIARQTKSGETHQSKLFITSFNPIST